jgi:hypothetical protein
MYYSVVRGPNRIAIHGWSVGLVGRLPVAVPRATERACWVENQALACSVLSLYICPSPSWVDSRIVVCDASAVYVKVKGGMSSERVESRELECDARDGSVARCTSNSETSCFGSGLFGRAVRNCTVVYLYITTSRRYLRRWC